jgi:hypothetical protein
MKENAPDELPEARIGASQNWSSSSGLDCSGVRMRGAADFYPEN